MASCYYFITRPNHSKLQRTRKHSFKDMVQGVVQEVAKCIQSKSKLKRRGRVGGVGRII